MIVSKTSVFPGILWPNIFNVNKTIRRHFRPVARQRSIHLGPSYFRCGIPRNRANENSSVAFVDSQLRSRRNRYFWWRNRFSWFTFNSWDARWSDISFTSFFSSNPRRSHYSLFSSSAGRSHNSLGTFPTPPPFVAFVTLGSSFPRRSRQSRWADTEVSTFLANL